MSEVAVALLLSAAAIALLGLPMASSSAAAASVVFDRIDVAEHKLADPQGSSSSPSQQAASLFECGVTCMARRSENQGEGCEGFRYNLKFDRSCELGAYHTDNFVQAYEPGNVTTYWMLRRSPDRCLVNYPGYANNVMLKEFCGRMGGRMPDLRQPGELAMIATLVQRSGTHLGIEMDVDGVWRYNTDGAEVPQEPIEGSDFDAAEAAQGLWRCARLSGEEIWKKNCNNRLQIVCQFC